MIPFGSVGSCDGTTIEQRKGGAKCTPEDVKGAPSSWQLVDVEEELKPKYRSHYVNIDPILVPMLVSLLSIVGSMGPPQ